MRHAPVRSAARLPGPRRHRGDERPVTQDEIRVRQPLDAQRVGEAEPATERGDQTHVADHFAAERQIGVRRVHAGVENGDRHARSRQRQPERPRQGQIGLHLVDPDERPAVGVEERQGAVGKHRTDRRQGRDTHDLIARGVDHDHRQPAEDGAARDSQGLEIEQVGRRRRRPVGDDDVEPGRVGQERQPAQEFEIDVRRAGLQGAVEQQRPDVVPAQPTGVVPTQAGRVAEQQPADVAPAQTADLVPAQTAEIVPAQPSDLVPAQPPDVVPAQAGGVGDVRSCQGGSAEEPKDQRRDQRPGRFIVSPRSKSHGPPHNAQVLATSARRRSARRAGRPAAGPALPGAASASSAAS